jgi:NAD(P)-dependent dehydrogenase (short-subunit alcohol dehydrogenase family)
MKYALVTGSTSGIGKEIAHQLLEKNFFVFVTGRDPKKLAAVKKEFGNKSAEYLLLDVNDAAAIKSAADSISKSAGRLDVLINNAAILGSTKGMITTNEKEFFDSMNTNAYGPLRMIRAFASILTESTDARIINISTEMSLMSNLRGNYASYRLSKYFLNGITILASRELQAAGIKVFAMSPGWVKTEMGGESAPLSVEKGAETAVWLATTTNARSGGFYENCRAIAF